MGLDHEPYKNQLRNKIVKSKMKNKGWANDVNVIHKGKGIQKGKIPIKHCNAQKWAIIKKFSNKWITSVLQRIDD
jgi:hypothetical protein